MDETNKWFALIVDAAVKGERCPQNTPHGPLPRHTSSRLAHAGLIKLSIYRSNYRVATILVGPHAGKKTKPPVGKNGRALDPHIVIDGERHQEKKRAPTRPGPSAPKTYAGEKP